MKLKMKKKVFVMGLALCGFATSVLGAEAPKSVRQIAGEFTHLEHVDGQIRVGYISLNEEDVPNKSSFGIGGHLHVGSKRYYGIMAGAAFYTVQDFGFNSSDPNKINPDFFDGDLDAYSILGEAFLDGQWGKTEVKLGRQVLDNPHADSDDIRMVPNLFSAYTVTNNNVQGLTLTAGLIDHMAGWENEIDASKFVNVGKVMGRKLGSGRDEDTNGIYLFSASYDGIERLDVDLWLYRFADLADDMYVELGYSLDVGANHTSLAFGVQYDRAVDSGDKFAGRIDTNTWGINVEANLADLGLTFLVAYNQDGGDTGAFASLGGGPFFTSLEDQTVDAIGEKGKAYILGADYGLCLGEYGELTVGAVYGKFEADTSANYETQEIDVIADYSIKEKYVITVAYAMIDDRTVNQADYKQFRLLMSADF